jgi:hypothetical protein
LWNFAEDKPLVIWWCGNANKYFGKHSPGLIIDCRWFRLWVHESLLVFVASAFLLINSLP